jgi:hypothetical protein
MDCGIVNGKARCVVCTIVSIVRKSLLIPRAPRGALWSLQRWSRVLLTDGYDRRSLLDGVVTKCLKLGIMSSYLVGWSGVGLDAFGLRFHGNGLLQVYVIKVHRYCVSLSGAHNEWLYGINHFFNTGRALSLSMESMEILARLLVKHGVPVDIGILIYDVVVQSPHNFPVGILEI